MRGTWSQLCRDFCLQFYFRWSSAICERLLRRQKSWYIVHAKYWVPVPDHHDNLFPIDYENAKNITILEEEHDWWWPFCQSKSSSVHGDLFINLLLLELSCLDAVRHVTTYVAQQFDLLSFILCYTVLAEAKFPFHIPWILDFTPRYLPQLMDYSSGRVISPGQLVVKV